MVPALDLLGAAPRATAWAAGPDSHKLRGASSRFPIDGAVPRARAPPPAAAKSEFEKLQADRALLPMFPYRDQLLAAVEAHQIVIIVGETGSGKTTQARGLALQLARHTWIG